MERIIDRSFVRRRDAGRASAKAVGVLPAHRGMTFLKLGAVGIGQRKQPAERAIGILVRDKACQPRIELLREVVPADLRTGSYGKAVIVERARGAQIDRCAKRAFINRSRLGLADHDGLKQLRSEGVEVERTRAIAAAGGVRPAGHAQRFHAVDPHPREIRAEATHGDLPALTGITVDGNTRKTLDRLCQIEIREGGNVIGHDGINNAGLLPLYRCCSLKASAITGHGDGFCRLTGRLGRLLGHSRCGEHGRSQTEHGCAGQQGARTRHSIGPGHSSSSPLAAVCSLP